MKKKTYDSDSVLQLIKMKFERKLTGERLNLLLDRRKEDLSRKAPGTNVERLERRFLARQQQEAQLCCGNKNEGSPTTKARPPRELFLRNPNPPPQTALSLLLSLIEKHEELATVKVRI